MASYQWYLFLLFSSAYILIVSTDCPAQLHTNGCSIPLSAPFPYKADFSASCNKHDVCYFCGVKYGWSRSDCDKAFLTDMETVCKNKFASGRKRSFWETAKNTWKVAQEIGKWPFISAKLEHCKQGAKIYYMSVDFFGADNYNNPSPRWCDDPCVVSRGDPNVKLR